MKYDEFKEVFVPLATVWTNSIKVAETKASSYFPVLEKFSLELVTKVCHEFVEISPIRLPLPKEFVERCYIVMGRGKGDDTFKPVPDEKAKSPAALKARREFWQKIADQYDYKEARFVLEKTGFKTLSYAMAEAIILEPDRRQRAKDKMGLVTKKEKEKKRSDSKKREKESVEPVLEDDQDEGLQEDNGEF